MEGVDRERFWKALSLAGSDIDGEALAAIRAAQAILKKKGVSWHQFVQWVRKRVRGPNELEHMLEELMRGFRK